MGGAVSKKKKETSASMNSHGLRCKACFDTIVLPVSDANDIDTRSYIDRAQKELEGTEVSPAFHLFLATHQYPECRIEAVAFMAVRGQSAFTE